MDNLSQQQIFANKHPMAQNHDGQEQYGENLRFKGVRQRSWGAWVTEVREPITKKRVWLGSYTSGEEAARVYDMGLLLLQSAPTGRLNFPNDMKPVTIPSQIAEALIQAAQGGIRAREASRVDRGNSGALPEISAVATMPVSFRSEWVEMQVVGSSVSMREAFELPGSSAAQKPTSLHSRNRWQSKPKNAASLSKGLRGEQPEGSGIKRTNSSSSSVGGYPNSNDFYSNAAVRVDSSLQPSLRSPTVADIGSNTSGTTAAPVPVSEMVPRQQGALFQRVVSAPLDSESLAMPHHHCTNASSPFAEALTRSRSEGGASADMSRASSSYTDSSVGAAQCSDPDCSGGLFHESGRLSGRQGCAGLTSITGAAEAIEEASFFLPPLSPELLIPLETLPPLTSDVANGRFGFADDAAETQLQGQPLECMESGHSIAVSAPKIGNESSFPTSAECGIKRGVSLMEKLQQLVTSGPKRRRTLTV